MDRIQECDIELACQKVVRDYYYHVDRREFEKAVELFTPDVDWNGGGVHLHGREELLEGLYGALGKSTIRHILTNTLVTVIDEDHAECRSYNTLYATHDRAFEAGDNPIPLHGPTFIVDMAEELVRTDEGWRIAKRRAVVVFRRDPEPIPLETGGRDTERVPADFYASATEN